MGWRGEVDFFFCFKEDLERRALGAVGVGIRSRAFPSCMAL